MEPQWHTLLSTLLGTGMKQKQIATAIGVTQGAVSQVLNAGGKRGFGFVAGNALIDLYVRRCASTETNTGIASDLRPDIFGAAAPPGENPYPTSTNEPEAAHG